MKRQTYSRRSFIQRWIYHIVPFLAFTQFTLNGCGLKESSRKKENDHLAESCDDFTGISEADLNTRRGLGYVKTSPNSGNQCDNCNLWLPPAKDKTCGGCLLFKGPVYPSGYCANWAARV
ncbi:MAG: high-potential iron-sulfur protein [Anaerolineales bacterium]|nr:high-potential iron-sulfur protein [Anaerolineales bacterium]